MKGDIRTKGDGHARGGRVSLPGAYLQPCGCACGCGVIDPPHLRPARRVNGCFKKHSLVIIGTFRIESMIVGVDVIKLHNTDDRAIALWEIDRAIRVGRFGCHAPQPVSGNFLPGCGGEVA